MFGSLGEKWKEEKVISEERKEKKRKDDNFFHVVWEFKREEKVTFFHVVWELQRKEKKKIKSYYSTHSTVYYISPRTWMEFKFVKN